MQLSIKPITKENRQQAEALQVCPNQINYIETVAQCLQEADLFNEWNPVAIYDHDCMIGFAMYGFLSELGQVWFDRFLIDQRFQRKGYGKKAIQRILKQMIEQFQQKEIYLSVYKENQTAIRLYQSLGFTFNGEYDTKGESVMVYLAP